MRGTNCNGDLIRYTVKPYGANGSILRHTLPADAKRRHLTLFFNRNHGHSWQKAIEICRGEAAYSALTILPNGNIGVLSEEDDQPAYDLWFTEVSIRYLLGSDGVEREWQ